MSISGDSATASSYYLAEREYRRTRGPGHAHAPNLRHRPRLRLRLRLRRPARDLAAPHDDLGTPHPLRHHAPPAPRRRGRPAAPPPAGRRVDRRSWRTTAATLGATHRVHAVDLVGGPGRSRTDGRPIRTAVDLTAWLDAVLDGLGLPSAAFCGHSYGGWIALRYALAAPDRTDRLVLLDPTGCFAGFRPGYLLRALPTLLRPTAARTAAFLAWETGGADHDPRVRRLDTLAAGLPRLRPVTGPRPTAAALAALRPCGPGPPGGGQPDARRPRGGEDGDGAGPADGTRPGGHPPHPPGDPATEGPDRPHGLPGALGSGREGAPAGERRLRRDTP